MKNKNIRNINESGGLLGGLAALGKGWYVILAVIVVLCVLAWILIYRSEKYFADLYAGAITKHKNMQNNLNLWTNPKTGNYCCVLSQAKNNTSRVIFDLGYSDLDLEDSAEDEKTRNAIMNILKFASNQRQNLFAEAKKVYDLYSQDYYNKKFVNCSVITTIKTKVKTEVGNFKIGYDKKNQKTVIATKQSKIGPDIITV